jgi:hypothetical protein
MKVDTMRLPLTCVILLVSLPLSAQSAKLTASGEKLVTFDCAKEQRLHSSSVPNQTSFTLNNNSREAIKIFWIRRNGGRDIYNFGRPIQAGAHRFISH